mgnify:CR=1 FL=1
MCGSDRMTVCVPQQPLAHKPLHKCRQLLSECVTQTINAMLPARSWAPNGPQPGFSAACCAMLTACCCCCCCCCCPQVAPWLLALGGAGIVVGLATYGYNIMRVLGVKCTHITPSR